MRWLVKKRTRASRKKFRGILQKLLNVKYKYRASDEDELMQWHFESHSHWEQVD
jgi:hypothetical protein